MSISAGLLDQKVTPLLPVSNGISTMGQQRVTWIEMTTRSARVQYMHGRSAITVGDAWLPSTISVTMRYTDVVTERCRIRWQGKLYYITSLNGSRRDGTLTLVCDRIDEGTTIAQPSET